MSGPAVFPYETSAIRQKSLPERNPSREGFLQDAIGPLASCASIILGVNLEEALRMSAGRADLRRFRADDDVTAVAALPDLDFALLEDLSRLDILQEGAIALLMMFLDLCDEAELRCQCLEALFLGRLSKALVHVSVHS